MKLSKLRQTLLSVLTSNEHVGVFVSGGLDSGLLLHLCAIIIHEEKLKTILHVFMVPDPDPDQQCDYDVEAAKSNIQWINKKFNTNLKLCMAGSNLWISNPNTYHYRKVIDGIASVRHLCKVIILGDTKNPNHLTNDPNSPKNIRSTIPGVIQPFIDITKDEVVRMIIELNLNFLMENSVTCHRFMPVQCGQCWSCRERAWAFEQNNYKDPGTF